MKLEINKDERGELVEVFKVPGFGQVNYVTCKPGAVRGNHYHKRKKESFCVIEGEAKITLKKGDEAKEYRLSGESPEIIEVQSNWIHNMENIGKKELKAVVWINEVFNPDDPDTYYEQT